MNHQSKSAADTFVHAMLPELLIDQGDLPAAVNSACDLLKTTGQIFSRDGMLVRVKTTSGEPIRIEPFSHHAATMKIHERCRPTKIDKDGQPQNTTFPERAAKMLVDCGDGFNQLNGIATAPLLSGDGTIRTARGYDAATKLWCENIPNIRLPAKPNRADAEAALLKLRDKFASFPFVDSPRTTAHDLDLVDTSQPPGEAESAFLNGLLTAICRPSLCLAPGLIITAPAISGAGSGKGLLVNAICQIAFGSPPSAFTAGSDKAELDKRIASELLLAGSALFLDNVNGIALKSDTLASVITERPARVRVFGQTKMASLNSTAFVCVTGNGLSVSEDLARRFIAVELDPKCDDPESREFAVGRDGFLSEIKRDRHELLAAALTIWRWGRQNADALTKGKPLGGFETWATWVRDPLLTLGCADPVAAIAKAKALDPHRLKTAEFFEAWWQHHGNLARKACDLHDEVKAIIDPHNRGRQYLATAINRLAGTRAGGFVLTRQRAVGSWGAATYALQKTNDNPNSGIPQARH